MPASHGRNFFFYGTLTDRPTLVHVLGRPLPAESLSPARLDGFRRVHLGGSPYPTLAAAPGQSTAGLLVQGINRAMRAKLERYEGPLYALIEVTVVVPGEGPVRASAFVARMADKVSDRPWIPAAKRDRR